MAALVGIDVGGTFTDLYYTRDGLTATQICKVPSTPQDPSNGLIDALNRADVPSDDLDLILHGTTIATNALIERRGARCALVTTKGFRDLLELGRRDRPDFYGLTGIQNPLIPRDLRFEVSERLDHQGNVVSALDEDSVRALIANLAAAEVEVEVEVEAVVISLMHSYVNPAHEARVAEILTEAGDWEVITSASVLREYYEFERTSTAVVQGYLQPLIKRYSGNLVERLKDWGFERQTLVMQSNGGLVPAPQLATARSAWVFSQLTSLGVSQLEYCLWLPSRL